MSIRYRTFLLRVSRARMRDTWWMMAVADSMPALIMGEALQSKRLVLSGSPGKTRTCNLLVNSQPLLPIELPGSAFHIKEQRNIVFHL